MSEEIKQETLDSPLVVHKKSDASYQEMATDVVMNETIVEEDDAPTLRRHRFKQKESNKGNKTLVFFVAIIVIAVGIAITFITGGFDDMNKKDTQDTTKPAVTQTTTSIEESYYGTIVVKGTYLFVNGEEVDGIEGLQNALKYTDKSTTAFVIISENADAGFFNDNVLPILMELGFYGEDTEITHKQSTGLVAKAEMTTAAPETTTTTTTTTSAAKQEQNTPPSTTQPKQTKQAEEKLDF